MDQGHCWGLRSLPLSWEKEHGVGGGRKKRDTDRRQDHSPAEPFQTREAGGSSGKSTRLCMNLKNLGSSPGSCCEPLFPYL